MKPVRPKGVDGERLRPDKVGRPANSERPERMLQWFVFEHLTDEEMRNTSALFASTAEALVHSIPPGPERTAALRKLLEAKDCAVRAVLEGRAMRAAQEARAEEARAEE